MSESIDALVRSALLEKVKFYEADAVEVLSYHSTYEEWGCDTCGGTDVGVDVWYVNPAGVRRSRFFELELGEFIRSLP